MSSVDVKLLWRDWRGGQLNLIITALVLAVMVVTAVSMLADRVERGLSDQISSFLAADLALRGGIPIAQEFRDKARDLNIESVDLALFPSMVFHGDASYLASIKVVEDNYPLRGQMELADSLDSSSIRYTSNGPAKGEAWVEARLLNLVGMKMGDTLEVGYSKLRVSALIVNEPDRGTGFASAGPRVMMNQRDLADSQLIRPGARVSYRFLMSGSELSIDQYQAWYKSNYAVPESNAEEAGGAVNNHYRLVTPENAEQSLADALQRGRAFLLLSGTIGVLLAGLAMALASHRYASRLTDQVALMKAWGQSSWSIRRSHFLRLSIIAVGSTLLGIGLGWLAHYLLMQAAQGLFNAQLPLPGWRPWLVAAVTGVMCVLGFALPALWHLPSIAPLRVLRRDLPDTLLSRGKRLWVGVLTLFTLTFWYSESLLMTLLFLGALFSLFAVCALIALQILKLVQRFGSWKGSYVRLGLANLWRRRDQTLVQLVGFSTTLMLLLVVTGMRTNLIAEWEQQLPKETPSHFIYNVSSSELAGVQELLASEQVNTAQWFPMVRGRLVKINGEPITRERMRQSDGLSREVNFTQSEDIPVSNQIIEGKWWQLDNQSHKDAQALNQFSIESDVAGEIGLKLGDEVEFSVGGLTFSSVLTSVRSVDWQSMNPNFYIVFSPGTLDEYAPNWVTSIQSEVVLDDARVVQQQAPFVSRMVKKFPTSVVLPVRDIIERIRNVITRVTQGLEMIMLLVLACGAMVLFAAIGVSFDERLRENAILRTLGSSKKIVIGALAVEYAALGAIAGLIASTGAELVLYFVQTEVFDMAPSWHPTLWVLGLLSGTILITILGLLRSRDIIRVPPLQSLRAL
jgi:putative ABC transport system permease protein